MMPLFHVFAFAMCLHLAAYCGGRLVIMPRYRPEAVLELIGAQKISRLPAGPTVFIGLLNHEKFAATDFSSRTTVGKIDKLALRGTAFFAASGIGSIE